MIGASGGTEGKFLRNFSSATTCVKSRFWSSGRSLTFSVRCLPPGGLTRTVAWLVGSGGLAPSVEVQVVMPWETATGQGQGLGELVGYGPISPQTCRDLLATASTLRRVLIDPSGAVVDVADAIRRSRRDLAADLERLRLAPVITRDLSTSAYRPTKRATRFVKTRDRICRFPGCTNLATGTDLDHCRPWPHGPTSPENLASR